MSFFEPISEIIRLRKSNITIIDLSFFIKKEPFFNQNRRFFIDFLSFLRIFHQMTFIVIEFLSTIFMSFIDQNWDKMDDIWLNNGRYIMREKAEIIKERILGYIKHHPGCSSQEILSGLNLEIGTTTIKRYLQDLIQDELIVPTG